MESKVKFSFFSSILTVVVILVLLIGCIYTYGKPVSFLTLLILTLSIIGLGLYYAPVAIRVDSDNITIKSMVRKERLPLSEVKDIRLFTPTMGAIRVCASGGFMGYWGLFKEGDIGAYTGYYGKASDCFLVTLKNGKKYLLGCENPGEITDYINDRIRSAIQ